MRFYITLDQDTDITREDSTAVPLGHLPIRAGEKNEKGDLIEIQELASETTNLEEYSWFHGNISRAEAEHRLDGCIPGSYLVRESQSKPGKYSISLRDDTRTGHHLIHKDSVWFLHPELRFNSLPELVEHYSKGAHGLFTVLRYPAPKPEEDPAPNSEQDDWEIDRSDVTIGQKLHGEIFEIFDALIKSRGISVFARPFNPVSI